MVMSTMPGDKVDCVWISAFADVEGQFPFDTISQAGSFFHNDDDNICWLVTTSKNICGIFLCRTIMQNTWRKELSNNIVYAIDD